MDIAAFAPFVVLAIVVFFVLRIVAGAIKTSAKLMLWMIVTVAVLGAGLLWYQSQDSANDAPLPTLSIPGSSYAP